MKFLIIAPEIPAKKWNESFKKLFPKIPIIIGDKTENPDEIIVAMVWKQKHGILSKFKNLKLIISMGAGVDNVVSDKTIPFKIPLCRIVDKQMAFSMSNYIIMAVLNYHRNWYDYDSAQKNKHWAQFEINERDLNIGILGIGHLGMNVAKKLHYLDFNVFGYSKNKKSTPFKSFYGNSLSSFLNNINVLICTVPLTPQTKSLLNTNLFQKLNNQTYLINVSRGEVQVEEDIIEAINNGKLSGAFLDVFEEEPLPKDSPLWSHPKVKITPHIASLSYSDEGVRQVMENYERLNKNKTLLNLVDRKKMY
tara:strand:- start:122 stop:1042 length:921 start_codon:yes stop_codon:yes gene_type:complete